MAAKWSAKRFSSVLVGVLGAFFLANVLLWHGLVHDIWSGSMSRLSGVYFRPAETTRMEYEKRHSEFKDYLAKGEPQTFEVLTIGDSFSNGGGKNHYQDYLTEKYHWNILNIPCRPFNNALQMFYTMDSTGYLDEISPKVVVLESVVWEIPGRFGLKPFTVPPLSREGLAQAQQPTTAQKKIQQDISGNRLVPAVMIKANFMFLASRFYAWTHPTHQPAPGMYMVPMTEPFFSNPGMENMLVFADHIDAPYTDKTVETVNANLNDAAELLAKKGIHLVVLPMVDKYTLYYPYLTDTHGWKENPFFEQMENLPRQYTMINTKSLLRKTLAEEKTKDIFWADDDHYSWRAYHIIADALAKEIQP